MEENKKTDFTKIKEILEKNNSASTWILIFLWVFTGLSLIFFGVLFMPHLIKDFSILKVVFLIFRFWLLGAFWYAILHGRKAEKILLEHINNWTIIVKKPKITEFEYYYDSDSDGHSSSWYIVVAQDWWVEYKSWKILNSFFTWERWITINKDYYIQRWIPYSLNDPKYLESMEYVRAKELEQQIKILKDQCAYVDEKEQKKLNKEIKELEKERVLLLPQHLISRWATYVIWSESIMTDYYIWDEINVFVDPDNPKNYLMEI